MLPRAWAFFNTDGTILVNTTNLVDNLVYV